MVVKDKIIYGITGEIKDGVYIPCTCTPSIKAIDYLKGIPRSWLPPSREGKKLGEASNSELKRWLEKGSVVINGSKPQPNDWITLPINELIFFPKGNRVTIIREVSLASI